MVQVSYPGVYIQEVPSGVHTITGVSTSIAAFLGRTSKGPINQAVRILSMSDFTRRFGEPHPKSDLADSVRLFFANGGTNCYVIRLAKDAKKASVILKSLSGERVLVATAKAAGVWANTLRLEVDYNTPNPDESFNLSAILEENGQVAQSESFVNLNMDRTSARFAPDFVSQSSELIDLELHTDIFNPADPEDPAAKINDISESFAGFSQSRRATTIGDLKTALKALINPGSGSGKSKFDVSVNGSGFATADLAPWTNGAIDAATGADIADHFEERINTALATVDPNAKVTVELWNTVGALNLITILADDATASAEPWASVRIRRASSGDIAAALMLGVEQGGIEAVRWSNFRPAPNAAFLPLGDHAPVGAATDLTRIIDTIANLDAGDVTKITLDSTDVPLTADPYDVTSPAAEKWFKSDPVSGSAHEDHDGVREKMRRIAGAINADSTLPYRAEVWKYHLAVMPKSGTPNTAPASVDTDHTDFNNDEFEINVIQYAMGTAGAGSFSEDGDDGYDGDPPGVSEYMGSEADQTGLYALDAVDLFNLMVLPGDQDVTETEIMQILGPASTYCADNRAFLLIDAPASWVKNGRPEVVQDTTKVGDLRSLVVKENSAVFYPHIEYSSGGLTKTIGPSGAIAGVMARIDSTRGVWKAPAGLEADLRTILGLDLKLTDMENGVLNKLGVNCLRSFPSGFVNWGARTLAGSDDLGSEWKYIPVRRMALFLEESLFRGTKWVVFEPNDKPLWAKIRLNLNAFMMRLFRQGAFQGDTPDKAFYVKCDEETTTQADINLGIVNIEVGFAPLKPAEFVVIKIQQIAGDL